MMKSKPTKTPLAMGHVLYEERTALTKKHPWKCLRCPIAAYLAPYFFLPQGRAQILLCCSCCYAWVLSRESGSEALEGNEAFFRYLVGTKHYGSHFRKWDRPLTTFEARSDADWARNNITRRSRSGTLLTVNDNPVLRHGSYSLRPPTPPRKQSPQHWLILSVK